MIYLASPYSDPSTITMEFRFREVCLVAAKLMQRKYHIFCPIAHTHPIATIGNLPLGFDFWEEFDREMIEHCEEFWVVGMPGWKESKGVTRELAIAKELRKPSYLISPSDPCNAMHWLELNK